MTKFMIICGAGAAGTGIVVAATQHGYLKEIIERGGIQCLERSSLIGGGMFSHLSSPANSNAGVFLECLQGLKHFLKKDQVSRLVSTDAYQYLHDSGAALSSV